MAPSETAVATWRSCFARISPAAYTPEMLVSMRSFVGMKPVSYTHLSVMGKPRNLVYQRFAQRYEQVNRQLGMKQFLVPYLMS